MWQDFVLTAGSVVFMVSLFPSVFGKDKPSVLTSLPTGIILAFYVFIYASLALWVTAALTVVMSILWLTLAYQKYKKKK